MKLALFKKLSWAEGLSFLLLLLIAMPLKYMFDRPEAVRVLGMIHGALFVAYIGGAFYMKEIKKWKIPFLAFVMLMSIVPFGMVMLDKRLK